MANAGFPRPFLHGLLTREKKLNDSLLIAKKQTNPKQAWPWINGQVKPFKNHLIS